MPTPTLTEWLEEWCASRRHHLEASSVRSYRTMADIYLLPHLGDVPLDELDVRTIEATYATLLARGGRGGKPLAPRTIAYAHAILHRSLVDAVRLGVLDANPAASVTLPAGLSTIAHRDACRSGTRNRSATSSPPPPSTPSPTCGRSRSGRACAAASSSASAPAMSTSRQHA